MGANDTGGGAGKVSSGPGSSVDKLVELAQKGGKWGIAGISVLMVKSVVVVVAHPSLDSATDALGMIGWSLVLIGILANTKRGNDMQATIGAESKIDRAVIAAELLPANAPVVARSVDPAVDREIKKQINGGSHPASKIVSDSRDQNPPISR